MPNLYSQDFWDDESDLLWRALSTLLLSVFLDGLLEGVDSLPADVQTLIDWDVLNTDALRYAQEYRYELISRINDTTRRQVQEAMANWITAGDPLNELENVLTPIFGEVRARMIAATEVTRVYADANTAAWQSLGFVTKVRWNTAEDDLVCPICGPLDGQEFEIGTDTPPAHVNCRCWLTPVVDVESVGAQAEGILNG